jgi:hypothetical protein
VLPIKAFFDIGGAGHSSDAMAIWASQKHDSYTRRNIFDTRPIILLGDLDWPAKDVEGPALYDIYEELPELIVPSDFARFGFSEILLMDDCPKYTSRRDLRTPAATSSASRPPERSGFGNIKESAGHIGASSGIF